MRCVRDVAVTSMHWADDAVLMTRRDAAAMLELGALAGCAPSHEHLRIDILERSLYSLHSVSSVVFLENIKLTVLCFCSRFQRWVCAAVQPPITRTFDIRAVQLEELR